MKDHKVEYMSMDHFMKSEKMQKKSQKMAEMGIPSCAGKFKSSEEAQKMEHEKREGYGFIYS